jgi:hypothetical protein
MKRVGCMFALTLSFISPAAAAPPLPAYGIDIRQTSVSGVSSGGAMAIQMHVAHSSIMRGVGVIAGVAYDCANSNLPSASARLAQGLLCMDGSVDYATLSIARTDQAAKNGYIDDPANLARQKVWLFSGYNDGSVRLGAMNAVAEYYDNYINVNKTNAGDVFYQTDNHAPHALITDDYGGTCLGFNNEYINNCSYPAAKHLLEHIYGYLNPPNSGGPSGSILEFDQRPFVGGGVTPQSVGIADTGYVYVPTACQTQTCRVHVVFHGCKQYAGKIGTAIVDHGGYNKWADTNKLIVLYPQTTPVPPSLDSAGLLLNPGNPFGCWDWWGFSDLPRSAEFARKSGYQISAIKAMLDRLAQKFVASGSSDTFAAPQNVLAADSTSSSVELIWQPNSAATGFNIYRSSTSGGTYTKRNSLPAKGASFVDVGLTPTTTYFYKISAIDGANQESAPTGPVQGTTVAKRPACDPYFSNNLTHVQMLRAFAVGLDAFAVGSLEAMGPNDDDHYSHLIKDGLLPVYLVKYCP